MKQFFLTLFLSLFFCNQVFSEEKIFNLKKISTFHMSPDQNSPIIYPLELGHEMVVEERADEWLKVQDKTTGLKGWVFSEGFGQVNPGKPKNDSIYNDSFIIFKEKVLEMSKSIENAIGMKTFIDVSHLGGVAAVIIADDEWFKGRRHQNQAFQVYDIWKDQNQSASFLSFRTENNIEKFIILSGPHRPRYLKREVD
ncbi:SH3 domain-containing protein [Rickettsiales bacterium]|nr:SH3 domain-containing protein [Rickettsiales bacterium]